MNSSSGGKDENHQLDIYARPAFFKELETLGLSAKACLRSIGLNGQEQPQLLLHHEAAEAEVMAALTAHNPVPPKFENEAVLTADNVDRVTARRIRDLFAPQWKGKDL